MNLVHGHFFSTHRLPDKMATPATPTILRGVSALNGTMGNGSNTSMRVEALIRRMDGAPLCDACITDRLDLSSVAQASVATSAAGGTAGFERMKVPCSLCGETRPVIRHKG